MADAPTPEAIVNPAVDSETATEPPSTAAPVDRQEWLKDLFDRLQRPLLAYALKLVGGDSERAQDCVQEAFVRLCREPMHKVESHADAWLYKTCRNHAMDVYRKESRMIVNSEAAPITELCSREPGPQQQSLRAEEMHCMEARIACLPKQEQEVVQLRLGQGLSYKQISEITDLSVSHVGVLLHQAVKRLKQSLASPDHATGM